MKYDRFLIGIVTGILLWVAVTIALFFVRTGEQSYVVDDSRAGVVHNYTLALMNGDYKMAYGFLADLKYKPTYAEFTLRFANDDYYYSDPNDIALEIGDVTYTGESAQVSLYTLLAG